MTTSGGAYRKECVRFRRRGRDRRFTIEKTSQRLRELGIAGAASWICRRRVLRTGHEQRLPGLSGGSRSGLDHCHGSNINHLLRRPECIEEGCVSPELVPHAFVIDCDVVGCACGEPAAVAA